MNSRKLKRRAIRLILQLSRPLRFLSFSCQFQRQSQASSGSQFLFAIAAPEIGMQKQKLQPLNCHLMTNSILTMWEINFLACIWTTEPGLEHDLGEPSRKDDSIFDIVENIMRNYPKVTSYNTALDVRKNLNILAYFWPSRAISLNSLVTQTTRQPYPDQQARWLRQRPVR